MSAWQTEFDRRARRVLGIDDDRYTVNVRIDSAHSDGEEGAYESWSETWVQVTAFYPYEKYAERMNTQVTKSFYTMNEFLRAMDKED